MSVTAPADARFRRSRMRRRPGGGARARGRWWRVVTLAGAGWPLLAGAGALGRAGRRRRSRALAVQHIRVTGNQRLSPARSLALLDGLTRPEHAGGRPRALARAAAGLRRGWPTRRSAARCPARSWSSIARARADGHRARRRRPVSRRRGRRGHRRVRAAVRGLSTCRSSTACSVTPASAPPEVDRARGQLVVAADGRRSARGPTWRGWCRRSTSADPHDVRVILDGDPAIVRLGETRVRRAPRLVRRPAGGAAGAGAGHRLRGCALRRARATWASPAAADGRARTRRRRPTPRPAPGTRRVGRER